MQVEDAWDLAVTKGRALWLTGTGRGDAAAVDRDDDDAEGAWNRHATSRRISRRPSGAAGGGAPYAID